MVNRKKAEIPATLIRLRQANIEIAAMSFTDAAELRAFWDTTNAEAKAAAVSSVDREVDVIIALAKMRSLLSQRGLETLRKAAGIKQTWTQYFAWFKKTYDLRMCLRTVINKIDLLEGRRLCGECHKVGKHRRTCSKYVEPTKRLTKLEAKMLGNGFASHEVIQTYHHGLDMGAAIKDLEKRTPTRLGRLPIGSGLVLSGKPGSNKSTAALSFIACVTTGNDWPDGEKNTMGPRDVLIAATEDDRETTIKPRLMAAGADCTKVILPDEYVRHRCRRQRAEPSAAPARGHQETL